MIKYTHGNIFDSLCPILVNPVDCDGNMSKGMAFEYKQKYPGMFSIYKIYCKNSLLRPGMPYIVEAEVEDNGKQIILLPIKEHSEDRPKLEWIESGFEEIEMYIHTGIITKPIAIPQLDGDLNWESEVKPLVEKHFASAQMLIEVYE